MAMVGGIKDEDVVGIEEEVDLGVDFGISKPEEEVHVPEDVEIMKSIQLKNVDKDVKKPGVRGKKKDQQVDQATEEKDLYADFSSFLLDKADIIADIGIKTTLSTGIDILDAILGGGFAVGALNIVVGQPGSGKSMIAIQCIGHNQQTHDDLLAAFLDSEEATTTIRMANLGVKKPKLIPYVDITIEKVFKFIEAICLFKQNRGIMDKPSILVWDSIANTLSEKEREADNINSVIGYKAKVMSMLIPKYISKLAKHNICLIAVNQLRDQLAMGQFAPAKELKFMSTGKDMPGGNILRYNAFHLIEMKVKSVVDPEKLGFEGIVSKVKCVKNKLFPPNVEIDIVGDFVRGFSNFHTNYNFLIETEMVKSGAWCYLINAPEKKFRTKEAKHLYDTDPVFKGMFDEAVKQSIKVNLIDRYNTVD